MADKGLFVDAAGLGELLMALDGLDEIERLDAFADAPLDVLLRVRPGVDARTEAAISTGHRGSKFGVCVEDVPSALARIRRTRWLGLKGLHMHLGSQLIVEPGRSLVARSTTTVYRVVTVKSGTPTFVAVDGGELVDLVRRQCESGDRLAAGVPLQDPRPGDLVAMPMTGAYTHTLVNNYNAALRPAVVFCADGGARACLALSVPFPAKQSGGIGLAN